MEQKSAQLSALRRTHSTLTDQLSSVRDELQRTRTALEQTAETATVRWRRIRKLEGQQGQPSAAPRANARVTQGVVHSASWR